MATLVDSPTIARALLDKWYITLPGILISLMLSVAACFVFPPQFSSTSTVVLIPAAQHGRNTLLSFDTGISTSAEIVVEAMNDPQVATEMGLVKGQDKVAVVNGNASSSGKIVESSGPFISVTAQSSTAERATAIAGQATSRVQEELADLQSSVQVKKQQSMNVAPVVSPTPGKLVLEMLLRTAGLTMLLGCVLTFATVCLLDRRDRRRRASPHSDADLEWFAAATALRSTNGARQRADSLDGVDVLAVAMSTEPVGEAGKPGRKKSVSR